MIPNQLVTSQFMFCSKARPSNRCEFFFSRLRIVSKGEFYNLILFEGRIVIIKERLK